MWGRKNNARELLAIACANYQTWRATLRGRTVSLKIEARYDPGTRAELRQRIAHLIESIRLVVTPGDEDVVPGADARAQLSEDVKALYMALTDCGPTHDEMVEMIGE